YCFAFHANYENQKMKDEKGVFISAGEFTYTTSDKAVLSPYRCYIKISEITDTEETDNGTKYTYGDLQEPSDFFNGHMANSTSMFIYDMDYEGMTTGVETLMNKDGESANYIGRQNVSHDLSGRAVSKSTKGLYIANGKKIIVK
ncbi:MAG: hypothetical protein MJZ40_04965, partial [Bacteroidaceae bacterium]|nr:hypothetical protein [Bacteroidaceae bacterium]